MCNERIRVRNRSLVVAGGGSKHRASLCEPPAKYDFGFKGGATGHLQQGDFCHLSRDYADLRMEICFDDLLRHEGSRG